MLTELRHLPAPAKLNLFLHVTGRRADGYHLLETAFQLIALSDTVHLQRLEDSRIERVAPLPGLPADDDLTVRAARRLAAASGCRLGVRIALDKRIPMGGGLGGGSSDAATVLLGLNRLWGLHWPRGRLAELALGLGADVPVFVRGDNAYATGIGERLRPLALPPRVFVVVAPGVAVPTAGIFSAPELTRSTTPIKIDSLSRDRSGFPGRNDLQPVVLSRHPRVAKALQALEKAARSVGIDAGLARMTGSGACLFLPVQNAALGLEIVSKLPAGQRADGLKTWVVRSLDRHPLREWAFCRD
ncbi:MAG: 4-(cytidine 5'-diphospho)-2-C-methyl-D-erythritol kinase [Burkholderiaceae bacterium]|nr:4-(cytidine 5'-diphospho)-2-C-methyl-D-erythritol kinase [Burkholderiaceae bacterium]